MIRNALLIVLMAACGPALAAQYPVRLEISASDVEIEAVFRTAIVAEIEKIPDVRIEDEGKFGLLVQLIRRPEAGETDDIFISAVSTSQTVCILEQEPSGRVVSRQSCTEFLASNTYIGRLDESRKLAQDIVSSFDAYVLNPLREIP